MGTFNGLALGGPERVFPALVLILVVFVECALLISTVRKKLCVLQ